MTEFETVSVNPRAGRRPVFLPPVCINRSGEVNQLRLLLRGKNSITVPHKESSTARSEQEPEVLVF